MEVLIFILLAGIITLLLASGLCYSEGLYGKGAIFLALGAALVIGTYEHYKPRHRNNRDNGDTSNACGFLDCDGTACSQIDCSGIDCNGVDCNGVDCCGIDCN